MELFRVVVKSGIIYFTTSKDVRVTVGFSNLRALITEEREKEIRCPSTKWLLRTS
jgi:hypothetical protein